MASDFDVEIKAPTECSEAELDTFENLVKVGGEVTEIGLRNRIKNARFLAMGKTASGEVAGIAALKINDDYRDTVFKKSQSNEKRDLWQSELGWIFVKEDYRKRGLATILVKKLLSRNFRGQVYATAREKNDPVTPLLKKFGFLRTGWPYSSERGDYKLILYIQHLKHATLPKTKDSR